MNFLWFIFRFYGGDDDQEHKLYVLIDFCLLKDIEVNIIDSLVILSCITPKNAKLIVALPSGAGHDATPHVNRLVHNLILYFDHRVYFNGFSEEEAICYLKLNNKDVKFDSIKHISGTNPLLLSNWVNENERTDNIRLAIYSARVKDIVTSFMVDYLKLSDDANMVKDYIIKSTFLLARGSFSTQILEKH